MLAAHSTNIKPIRDFKLRFAAVGCALLGLVAGPLALPTGAAASPRLYSRPSLQPTSISSASATGLGLGMGQWGAFGYAAVDHEPYQWILAHYYGGTTLSSADNLVSTDPLISVDLNENDGAPVVVTSAVCVLIRRAPVPRRTSGQGSAVLGKVDPFRSCGVRVN